MVIISYKPRFWKNAFEVRCGLIYFANLPEKVSQSKRNSASYYHKFVTFLLLLPDLKKKIVFSRKTVRVIKILHVKFQEDPLSRNQVFLCEGKDKLTDKTKVTLFAIL